jgi:hypothetical protein
VELVYLGVVVSPGRCSTLIRGVAKFGYDVASFRLMRSLWGKTPNFRAPNAVCTVMVRYDVAAC